MSITKEEYFKEVYIYAVTKGLIGSDPDYITDKYNSEYSNLLKKLEE